MSYLELSAPIGEITFTSRRDGGEAIYTTDGSEVVRTVDHVDWKLFYPSWSPDGNRIAFSADGELVVLDLQQGTRRRLTRGYSYVSDPSWSPDQTFIAFASNRKGAPEIYVVEIATERIARITLARDIWGDREPVWYPGDHAIPTIPSVEVLTPLVRTEVEATVLGAEVEGLTVEFARAIAGRQPDYAWSAITDATGWLELTITSPNRTGVSGYYQAQARNADGEVVGQWPSIPLNQGRRQILELTLGGGVRVVAVERLDAAKEVAQRGPLVSSLEPNYPNPFNTSTQIAYRLATPGLIRLEIYNALGQPVCTLVDQIQAAGFHQVHWDARDQRGTEIAAGVYITRLLYPGGVQTRRLLLLK